MVDLIDELLKALEQKRSIELTRSQHKIYRSRLRDWIESNEITALEALLQSINSNDWQVDRIIDSLLVKISFFFRNGIVFEKIGDILIPEILQRQKETPEETLRIWSAGCSSGDEAYSMAILVLEACKHIEQKSSPLIFATDISDSVLEAAKLGNYSRDSLREMKLKYLDTYFQPEGPLYRLKKNVREMVRFSKDDLLSPSHFAPPESIFGSFDIILCRNVLIYYSGEKREQIVQKLYHSLNDRGYLILGEAEMLPGSFNRNMEAIDAKNHIYQKLK